MVNEEFLKSSYICVRGFVRKLRDAEYFVRLHHLMHVDDHILHLEHFLRADFEHVEKPPVFLCKNIEFDSLLVNFSLVPGNFVDKLQRYFVFLIDLLQQPILLNLQILTDALQVAGHVKRLDVPGRRRHHGLLELFDLRLVV